MASLTFSVPEDVKQAFNRAFEGQNKSAVLTQLMREAIARVKADRCRQAAAQRILGRRHTAPVRGEGRRVKARLFGRP